MKIFNLQFPIFKRSFLFLFIALAAVLSFAARLLPHAPNFTPVGALALFVGMYANKNRWSLLLPLGVMFLSDLFIGFYEIKLMAVVYASFLGYSLLGLLVAKKKNILTAFLASIGGATIFYLTTNFAVWAFSSWYPHTLWGLMMSYTLALPFFKNTLVGDIFFTGVFFCSYEFLIPMFAWRSLTTKAKKSM